MSIEVMKPWDKLDEETGPAYAAFTLYRDLPQEDRSYDAGYRAWLEHKEGASRAHGARRAPYSYRTRAKRFQWKERAAAWDQHLAVKVGEARERVIEERAEEEAIDWFARRQELNLRLDKSAEKLIDMADRILALPVVETELQDGTTIVKPIRGATPTAAATCLRTAEELTDKIVGEETGEAGTSEGGVWTVAPDPEDEDE